MRNHTVYLTKSMPFIIKVSAGGSVYPEVWITDPDGQLNKLDLTLWEDNTPAVVDVDIYTAKFTTYDLGVHFYKVVVWDDINKTEDVTDERLCSQCDVGSFDVINNPIAELVSDFSSEPGSVADYLQRILAFLLLYEEPGNGTCPVDIDVPNGQGVAVRVTDIDGKNQYARDILNSFGKARFFLSAGTYRFEFYPPCGKVLSNSYVIREVTCGGTTVSCS